MIVLTILASNSGSRTHKAIIVTDLQFQGHSVTAEVAANGGSLVCRSFLGKETDETLG